MIWVYPSTTFAPCSVGKAVALNSISGLTPGSTWLDVEVGNTSVAPGLCLLLVCLFG